MLTTDDLLAAEASSTPEDLNLVLETAPYDPRFPNTNQSKNCWQNYVDFHKCQRAKGEEYEPCYRFKRIYKILCPSFWVENWDTALEEGRIPFKLDPPQRATPASNDKEKAAH